MNSTAGTLKKANAPVMRMPDIFDIVVLGSFVVSVIWLVFQLVQGNTGTPGSETHPARDYVLMLLQCSAGVVAIHIPRLLNKFLHLHIPAMLRVMFSAFLFCAIFLGEVANFYYLVPHWDDVLHFGSGMMLCLLGFMLANVMNRKTKLSPAFIAVFGLCFALAVGGLWEVYEFTFDGLLGLNMQKTVLANGEVLAGHLAIADTMKDIIVDTVGAGAGAVLGYQSIKRGKTWITGTVSEKKDILVPFETNESKAA